MNISAGPPPAHRLQGPIREWSDLAFIRPVDRRKALSSFLANTALHGAHGPLTRTFCTGPGGGRTLQAVDALASRGMTAVGTIFDLLHIVGNDEDHGLPQRYLADVALTRAYRTALVDGEIRQPCAPEPWRRQGGPPCGRGGRKCWRPEAVEVLGGRCPAKPAWRKRASRFLIHPPSFSMEAGYRGYRNGWCRTLRHCGRIPPSMTHCVSMQRL